MVENITRMLKFAVLLIFLNACSAFDPTPACPYPRKSTYGYVCDCVVTPTGGEQCGEHPDASTAGANEATIITSQVESSYMLSETVQLKHSAVSSQMDLGIDETVMEQSITGFGGAFTDAVAYLYEGFKPAVKSMFIRQYFGTGGIGYTTGATLTPVLAIYRTPTLTITQSYGNP